MKSTDPSNIDFKKKFELTNKVIIITGACGLIGKAFVEATAQFGANVVLADLEQAKPVEAGIELNKKFSQEIIGAVVNVSDKKSVVALRDAVIAKFGKIDGLVNAHQNKTHLIFEAFENVTEDNWDTVVEVNLKGTFLTCQVIGTHMSQNGGGAVVNMPSTYSIVAPNQNLYKGTNLGCPAAYSASKGGIEALSKYLASYWASKKVRVNMLTPHGVWNNHEEQFENNFAKFSPMERMSLNHEIAPALIYLLSDASSYVTGANILNDGGWTVW